MLRFLPVYGFPLFLSVAGKGTSSLNRHLRSHLRGFFRFSRKETPVGRLRPLGIMNTDFMSFGAGPCFIPYPPHYAGAFAFSDFSNPSLHQHALRFCLPCLAHGGVTAFPRSIIIDHCEQLRRSLNAGSPLIPYGHVSDPHPACMCKRWDAHP